MTRHNSEQLDQLLRQFLDGSSVEKAAEDIRAGDQAFDNHPVMLNQQTRDLIHSRVNRNLARQKLLTEVKWIASVAAMIIFTTLVGLYALLSDASDQTAEFPYQAGQESIWHNKLADNSVLDQIERELVELTESIQALDTRLYEPFNRFSIDLMELEELENLTRTMDFVKG